MAGACVEMKGACNGMAMLILFDGSQSCVQTTVRSFGIRHAILFSNFSGPVIYGIHRNNLKYQFNSLTRFLTTNNMKTSSLF